MQSIYHFCFSRLAFAWLGGVIQQLMWLLYKTSASPLAPPPGLGLDTQPVILLRPPIHKAKYIQGRKSAKLQAFK